MNDMIKSRFGRALYEALPEVYRTRDNPPDPDKDRGHLAAYLDSCGELLDAVYNSLDQRYKDCFPETCQEWLLPYFAQLVATTTLSPHVDGKREEIKHAVAWYQGKGSLRTIQEIAEKIGGFEKVLVQEGWKRVARTAHVDGLFVSPEIVDLHKKSPKDFIGRRNTAPHSVDVRKPSWIHGHPNPHAVLIYAPPFPGFFAKKEVVSFSWKNKTVNGKDDIDSWFTKGNETILPRELMGLDYDEKEKSWFFYKQPGVDKIIRIKGEKIMQAPSGFTLTELKKEPKAAIKYRFSELNLDGSLTVPTGTYLSLEKLSANIIHVSNGDPNTPLSGLIATDCLLQTVEAPNSFVRFAHCTVLGKMTAELLEASDCIFMEILYKNGQKRKLSPAEISYSRHSQESVKGGIGNTTEMPVFYSSEWGAPGCAVLHPASSEAIRHGAEDGGEMGVFHHRAAFQHRTAFNRRAYALAWEAVAEKLKDYLPVGMSAALIPDKTLFETD